MTPWDVLISLINKWQTILVNICLWLVATIPVLILADVSANTHLCKIVLHAFGLYEHVHVVS